jgi:hypothetical protein
VTYTAFWRPEPPTKEQIDKLLDVAPKYGIEITLPEHLS